MRRVIADTVYDEKTSVKLAEAILSGVKLSADGRILRTPESQVKDAGRSSLHQMPGGDHFIIREVKPGHYADAEPIRAGKIITESGLHPIAPLDIPGWAAHHGIELIVSIPAEGGTEDNRLTLRLPPALRERLDSCAKDAGRSTTSYAMRVLAAAVAGDGVVLTGDAVRQYLKPDHGVEP